VRTAESRFEAQSAERRAQGAKKNETRN